MKGWMNNWMKDWNANNQKEVKDKFTLAVHSFAL